MDEPAEPEPAFDAPPASQGIAELLVGRLRDRLDPVRDRVTKRPFVVVAALLAVAVVAFGAWYALEPPAPPPELSLPRATPASPVPAGPSSGSPASAPATVTVDVVGAVARPGLVEVPGGSRVADAVKGAGGAAPDADLERLNMAASLNDGERIYVPHVGETAIPLAVNGNGGSGGGDAGGGGGGGSSPAAPVDLNQADEQQLESLPGVGPATAQAILDYRREHGRFTSVDDLLNVRGIGPAKLASLRARVRV